VGVLDRVMPGLLVGPAVVVVLAVVAFPMLYSLYLSFTDFSLIGGGRYQFVGLRNYVDLVDDNVFRSAFIRTVLFLAVAVNLELVLGLAIAHLMARAVRLQSLLRTVLMMPMMFAPVLVGFQFKWFFHDQVGLVNNLLNTLAGRDDIVIAWLVEYPLGLLAILVAEVWMSTPFMVIVLLAGLLSLPREPFEAAEVDGASGWQKFRYVTYPLLTPYIFIALAVRSLDIARAYDAVRIMTDGGPAHRTELIWTYVFRVAITDNHFALGAAMSYVAVALSFVFTVYLFRQLLRAREARG
jgi:multiple sugar transport system permease protein